MNWDLVVDLVQTEFRDGFLMEELICKAVVLLPEGGDDYRRIGLVKVVWKTVTVILNFCFTASIANHDSLCGFLVGRGTRTASLEVKLIQ